MAEVVLHVDPNPKRAGTGAFIRYQGYAIGRTREDLMETGLSKRDIDWDEKQGHVKFGEGERSTAPIVKPSAPPPAPVSRGVVKSAPAAAAEPEHPAYVPPSRASATTNGHPEFPGLKAVMAPASGAKGFAAWHLVPDRIEVTAPEGSSDREWSFVAIVGTKRFTRAVASDRVALSRIETYLTHGIDPDDWVQVKAAA